MKTFFAILLLAVLAVSFAADTSNKKFAKPPVSKQSKSRNIEECDKKFNNKKMYEEFSKKAKILTEKKKRLEQRCAGKKNEQLCKRAKVLAPKIAFYKQQAKKWKHRCALLRFRKNRLVFYRFMKQYEGLSKKIAKHQAAYEVLIKKANANYKHSAAEKKIMIQHQQKMKHFHNLAKKFFGNMQKLVKEYENAKKTGKSLEAQSKIFAQRAKKFEETAQKKLNEFRDSEKKYKDFKLAAKINKEKAQDEKKKLAEHQKKEKQLKEQAHKVEKDKKQVETKLKKSEKKLKEVKKHKHIKKGCAKRIHDCSQKHGYGNKNFKNCAGHCY